MAAKGTTEARLHPAFSTGMRIGGKARGTAFSPPSGSRIPSGNKGK